MSMMKIEGGEDNYGSFTTLFYFVSFFFVLFCLVVSLLYLFSCWSLGVLMSV